MASGEAHVKKKHEKNMNTKIQLYKIKKKHFTEKSKIPFLGDYKSKFS